MDTGVIGSDWDLHCARDSQTDSPHLHHFCHLRPAYSFLCCFSPAYFFSQLCFFVTSFCLLCPVLCHYLSGCFFSVWVVMCSAAVQCVQLAALQWLTCPFCHSALDSHKHQLHVHTYRWTCIYSEGCSMSADACITCFGRHFISDLIHFGSSETNLAHQFWSYCENRLSRRVCRWNKMFPWP